MTRLLTWFFGTLALLMVGCTEPNIPPDQSWDPVEVSGEVDTSLSAADQAKQAILQQVLMRIQEEDVPTESLSNYIPGMRFMESTDDFLDGTLNLARWDFDGAPTGSDVPVVLFFSVDSSGTNEKEVRRVYTVSDTYDGQVIRRKE